MAGKRTVFSSGAVDIREPGTRAAGACSFYLHEIPPPRWASWVKYTTLPTRQFSVMLAAVKSMGALTRCALVLGL